MQEIWNRLYNEAKRALNPRKVSDMVEAGGVAAAIEAGSGKIYVGVCVDTSCTLGICAERNAIFNMITNGESVIKRCCDDLRRRQSRTAVRSVPRAYDANHAARLQGHRNYARLQFGTSGNARRAHARVVDLILYHGRFILYLNVKTKPEAYKRALGL